MNYDIYTLVITTVSKLCHGTNHYHLVWLYDDKRTFFVSFWYLSQSSIPIIYGILKPSSSSSNTITYSASSTHLILLQILIFNWDDREKDPSSPCSISHFVARQNFIKYISSTSAISGVIFVSGVTILYISVFI